MAAVGLPGWDTEGVVSSQDGAGVVPGNGSFQPSDLGTVRRSQLPRWNWLQGQEARKRGKPGVCSNALKIIDEGSLKRHVYMYTYMMGTHA